MIRFSNCRQRHVHCTVDDSKNVTSPCAHTPMIMVSFLEPGYMRLFWHIKVREFCIRVRESCRCNKLRCAPKSGLLLSYECKHFVHVSVFSVCNGFFTFEFSNLHELFEGGKFSMCNSFCICSRVVTFNQCCVCFYFVL